MPNQKQQKSNNEQNDNSYTAQKNNEKEQQHESNKKAAKVAAKAAADYFTGGTGGAVVDKLANTKLGNEVLNKGADILDKVPGMGKTTKKLDDSGGLDIADKALSMGAGGAGAAGGAATGAAGNAASGVGSKAATGASAGGENGLSGSSGLGMPGLGSKKGGLSSSDSSNDDKSDSGNNSLGGLSNITGFGSISPMKKYMIIGGVCLFVFFFLGMLAFSAIGGADEDDGENGIGSPDKDYAMGSQYEDQINNDNSETSCGTAGTCAYAINDIYNGGRIYKVKEQVTNLKVKLMNCSNSGLGTPIPGEELVDFEKYILGVVYAEIGESHPESPTKVQAIAARSYSLVRPYSMGNSAGLKLHKEGEQWILQIRNCTEDQVYCDPDKGCSNTTNPSQSGNSTTVYSGAKTKQYTYKGKLAENNKIRQWVAETAGEVVINSKGQLINANFVGSDQVAWETTYKNLDYKQVLLQYYNQGNHKFGASEVKKMECSGSDNSACNTSTGDYSSWLQYGQIWSSIPLGKSDKTIQSAGCLVTSIAMLIAKSGVPTNVEGEFNPGTFVKALNKVNSFSSSGNFTWSNASEAAPNFVYQNSVSVSGYSKSDKLNKIKSILDQGYYAVAEVKGNTGQHWVAIDSINGNNIKMMDPGSESTDMWNEYNWNNTSRISYFKAN